MIQKGKKNLFSSIPEKYKMTVRRALLGESFVKMLSLTWNFSEKPPSVHSSMVFTSTG